MTTYNYLSEMQHLCFRAKEALKVLNDDGMKDFYAAAEEGFFTKLDGLPVKEADETINQSQIETYLKAKAFAEQKEHEAAEKIKSDTQDAELDGVEVDLMVDNLDAVIDYFEDDLKEPEAEVCKNQKVLY